MQRDESTQCRPAGSARQVDGIVFSGRAPPLWGRLGAARLEGHLALYWPLGISNLWAFRLQTGTGSLFFFLADGAPEEF